MDVSAMISYKAIVKYMISGQIKYMLSSLALGISLSLISGYSLILTKRLVDEFVDAKGVADLAFILLAILLIKLLQVALQHTNMYVEQLVSNKTTQRLNTLLADYVRPKTITAIETPAYRNEIGYLRNAIQTFSRLIPSLSSISNQLLLLGTYSIVIFNFNKMVVFVLLATLLPTFFFENKRSKLTEKFSQSTIQLQRESGSVYDVLITPDYQKEVLLFQTKTFLYNKWLKSSNELIQTTLRFKLKEVKARMLMSSIGPIRYVLIQFFLIASFIKGALSIGEYVSIGVAVTALEASMNSIVINVGVLKQASLIKNKLKDFLAHYQFSRNEEQPKIGSIESISLVDLNFSYPARKELTLEAINLDISLGEIIVIAGSNGSGKSTLGKVILGLHEVGENSLLYNGIDSARLNRESIYNNMSAVNQDYIKYPFSLKENVAFGPVEEAELRRRYGGPSFDLLPEVDYDARLGNEFMGSQQLSGGQWQRIAIARALYANRPFLVLDEATASLDPQAEISLLNHIIHQRKGLTTILITHQLYMGQYADKIVFMDKGKIGGIGTHEELYRSVPEYKLMFDEKMSEGAVPA